MSPIYSYRCPQCSGLLEEIRCMKDRNKKPKCALCEIPMPREQEATPGFVKNPAVPRRPR